MKPTARRLTRFRNTAKICLCLSPQSMFNVGQTQRFKVWFYVGFVNLVRVFVVVHSPGMADTAAIRERSTSRRKAVRIWPTSHRPACPVKWTSSPHTMTVYSARTSVCGPAYPCTRTRWSSTLPSTRPPITETGKGLSLMYFQKEHLGWRLLTSK